MAVTRKTYGSSAEIQNYFIENIAPNYFDFSNVNNYRSGLFGYINEMMSIAIMDAHNTINVARREFYPVSAQFPRSFYKMAAVQQIGLPLVTPARCSAVLMLDEDEVIQNGTTSNGVHTCVIDSTLQIEADILTFSILYPIVIISSKVNGDWVHTIHYDKGTTNDLDVDPNNSNYIVNKTINRDGKHYLLLSVLLYQCTRDEQSLPVTTDSSIQTVSLEYEFDGDLANFEVFYLEDSDSSTAKPIHLKKLLEGSPIPKVPFCYYRLTAVNKLELIFPRNIVFTPELNSEVRVVFYTSEGEDGNFPIFKGDLVCSVDSETYPYNNNMTMIGIANGASKFGKSAPSLEEYKEIVKAAYSTNNTITTEHDLQVTFDLNSTSNNKVTFRKKRSDAFDRLYGAYILIRDNEGNVVPSNTLTINMKLRQFDSYTDATSKAVIKPGMLFEYDGNIDSIIYEGKKVTDLTLRSDLSSYDDSTDRFIYTNPFLIMCTLNPNLVGYYLNSMDDKRTIEHVYMNDESLVQFIGSNFRIQRNAIEGENFYKFSIRVSPTQEIDTESIITIPDREVDSDYYIRAEKDGVVTSVVYDSGLGAVIANITYNDGEQSVIQISSYVNKEESDPDDVVYNDDGFYYHTGYALAVKVHDSFLAGDILATKKVTDRGRIRACIDLENLLFTNGLYIPMVIEEYDEELNSFTFAGYVSTDDIVDNNNRLLILNGIYDTSGNEDDDISIPFRELFASVSIFFKNEDVNLSHKYSNYDYFHTYTLTNTYKEDSTEGISLIKFIAYIRSTLSFSRIIDEEIADDERSDEEESESSEYELPDESSELDLDEDLTISIKGVPLVKANWIKERNNFSYLIEQLNDNYDTLQGLYYNLENDFNFDLKFYNTYGKSKFFKVGIRKEWVALSRVNCTFKFGVYLNGLASRSAFLSKFREFIKNKVESVNSVSSSQQSIYIMSLVNEAMNSFSELDYMEYYGFNDFDESVQKIQPVVTSEMSDELLRNYIPEFINIASHEENGVMVPSVDVTFLNDEE